MGATMLTASGEEWAPGRADLALQAAQYNANAPKTIVELQQFRGTESANITRADGHLGRVMLINLDPRINTWFLLMRDPGDGDRPSAYHLENPKPARQVVHLNAATGDIHVASDGRSTDCGLSSAGALEAARESGLPYAPLCDGRLFLRNRVAGRASDLEAATDFLRKHVWGGEKIIGFVRGVFYRDRFAEEGAADEASPPAERSGSNEPLAALLDRSALSQARGPTDLGVDLGKPATQLAPGDWYAASGVDGVYVSFLQPKLIASNILGSYRDRVNGLDTEEAGSLDYLIAFDLGKFNLGFALGTDHPGVGWSDRPPAAMRDGLPGPDGIGTASPLVRTGMISPAVAPRVVATFAGGFKRQHGAFRYGPLAQRNHGSHYGFIEQGVVFSKLQPDLSTLYMLDDGTVDMKTWTRGDDALLPRIKFARQNGVSLVEYDPATGISAPGALVNRWGPGNWSGSADEKLRTLRAGTCLQVTQSKRFLIYGYFSTATPSAMARVFQAYGCRYAMHLDMNAPVLTYLALYRRQGSQLVIEHLVSAMSEFDRKSDGKATPRFLGTPDNRDFFYVTRQEGKQ